MVEPSRLRALLRVAAWLLAVQATFLVGYQLGEYRREEMYLGSLLASWDLPADPLARVLAIRDHVRDMVGTDGLDVHAPRPVFRDGAIETLRSGKGFCGEDSRAVIRLLERAGFPARRVYLSGGPDTHVLAEARVGDTWVAVDAQRGKPETLDLKESMAALGMTRLSYISPRLAGLERLLGSEEAAPASGYTALTESPSLLLALLGGQELILALAFLAIASGRPSPRREPAPGRDPKWAPLPDATFAPIFASSEPEISAA